MPAYFVTTADAVDREVRWLTAFGDGLPPLLIDDGGLFEKVEAYWPRVETTRVTRIFVRRASITEERSAHVRFQDQYAFELLAIWPMSDPSGDAQQSQRDFDVAIDAVLGRIRGPLLDKTHGGAFLSAAEIPRRVHVQFLPPAQTLADANDLRAVITYSADDPEGNG